MQNKIELTEQNLAAHLYMPYFKLGLFHFFPRYLRRKKSYFKLKDIHWGYEGHYEVSFQSPLEFPL